MRIKIHPDRLKKECMSDEEKLKIDEEAAKVGQAADILLSDPALVSFSIIFLERLLMYHKRMEHDQLQSRWRSSHAKRARR